MYKAKIITETGKIFNFGYEYGVLFDVSPLNGTDVRLGTSQGFNQVGETVESQSVGGINRTIRGTVMNRSIADAMIATLPIFTSGKLYFNDDYFCDIVINRTPQIDYSEKTHKYTFSMRVFCSSPFWHSKDLKSIDISGYEKAFSFPVVYDTHSFTIESENAIVNIFNSGSVPSPVSVEFVSSGTATNYGIINMHTLQKLQFDDTLSVGEIVKVFYENGVLKATKQDSEGNISGHLGYLSDDSLLFNILSGDNVIKTIADENASSLKAFVSFRPSYSGVLP